MSKPDHSRSGSRLAVLKTYKLYIGGKFPRTESGRYMTAIDATTKQHIANYGHASRKDLRDAVTAARSAFPGWSGITAYLRGQILYRAAEMMESRRATFIEELVQAGTKPKAAAKEVSASIDRLVYFAGWTDKYTQVFGGANPVASSHFNFSTPEPTGVVGVICPDAPALLGLVTTLATTVLSGNTAVALASEKSPLPAITFAEVLATSDLPAGVINILTGSRKELAPIYADHMDVNAIIDAAGDQTTATELQRGVAKNLKRYTDHSLPRPADWFTPSGENPYRILDTLETKTTWHPVGI